MNFKSQILVVALLFSHMLFASDCDKHLADEMFEKNNFSLAQSYYIHLSSCDVLSQKQLELIEFRIAFCAIELFNQDAEYLLLEFIEKYPNGFLINDAVFQLARLYFVNKEYSRVLARLSTVNPYRLTEKDKVLFYFRQAYSSFIIGDYEQSKLSFYQIKDVDFRFKELVQYYPSHIAYLEGNYATALNGFEKLSNVSSLGQISRYYIAQIYYFQKRYDELIAYATPLVDSVDHSRNDELNRLIGDAYYFKKDYKKSVEYLENYKSIFGLNRLEKYQLGFSYTELSQFENAIDCFDDILDKQDSLSQFASYHLGECYLKLNQKSFAANAFRFCSSLSFNIQLQEDAFFNYVKLSVENSASYNDAIEVIKSYLDKFSDSDNSWEVKKYLLKAYSNSKDYHSAIDFLQNLETLSLEEEIALQRVSFFNAINYFNLKDYSNAIKYFDLSLKVDQYPSLTSLAYYWMAESYFVQSMYAEAINCYKKFIYSPSSISLSSYSDGYYGLAYANYMSNNFTESIRWFRKFVDVESSTKKTADAYFRLGDAYFLTNDYQRAIEFYKSAQLQNVFDVDYAIYQQLICHGLINQSIQQKSLLNLLINEYPNSPYHDDALMQLGDILINTNGETKEGVKQLNDLIHLHPNSSLVKSAYLKLGLYYYNIDENDKAILNFKKVVTNFPSTKQAKEALMAYKNVSVEMGSVKDYLSFVDGLSNLNVSRSAQDSITFEAAETLFFKQDFLKSSIAFEDYLSLFDQPIFKNSAYFYLSESYFELEKFDQALDNYLLLNELNDSRYVERVLSQIAFIEFEKKQYGIAALHFKQLIDIAQNKESKRSAIISLFLCNKELGVEKEIIKSSEQILSLDKVDQQILVEAKLILANVLYDKSEFYAAKKEYLSICNQTNNSFGAESKYKLALLSFTAEDYQSVESSIFDLAENYSDEYFIAKGFILLSDLYVKQENYFQAKATLESIVENYEGDDLKNLAILKLEQLKSLEEDQKPINEPQLIIELLNDIDFDEEENLLENEE